MPTEAARGHHVVGVTFGRRLHHHHVVAGVDDDSERRAGGRRPDQPGTGLVDGEPEVGHRIEVQIGEGADGTHQIAQDREISRRVATLSSTAAGERFTAPRRLPRSVIRPPGIVIFRTYPSPARQYPFGDGF